MNYLILLWPLIVFEASGTILHKWVYNQQPIGTSQVPDSINPTNADYKMTLVGGAKITTEGLLCNYGYGETAGNIKKYGKISHTLEARVKLTGVAWGVSPVALDSDYNPTTYTSRQFDAIVNNENSDDNKWIAGSDYFRRTKKPMTGNGVAAETLNEWIHIMISYNVEDELVTIYRNGQQYGDSYKPAGGFMDINDKVRALACVRLSKPTWNVASLIGTIAYAAIHSGAKTPADVIKPPAHFQHITTCTSKCLQVNDDGYVKQYTCVPNQINQLFYYIQSSRQIVDAKYRCMDFAADALVYAGGQPVIMAPCDPSRATFQSFTLDAIFSGYIKTDQLSTSHFGNHRMCLNLGGGSDAEGTVIQAWICYWREVMGNEVFKFETKTSAKAGLFDLDEGITTNTATGQISSQMVIYGMYSLIGLLLINIICFIMYCFKNKQNNTYKVISMETDTDIERVV